MEISSGEEWRSRARRGLALEPHERLRWEREQQWERENPALVRQLERRVGTVVSTARELRTNGGDRIPPDARFLVRARFGDRLFCESTQHGVLLLSLEWLQSEESDASKGLGLLG